MTKRLLAALFAMSLVFAACGSDDDDDSDTTTTAGQEASGTTMAESTTTADMMGATTTSHGMGTMEPGDGMGSSTTMGSETTVAGDAAEGDGNTFKMPTGLDADQQAAADVWKDFLTSGATTGAEVKDMVQDGDELEGVLDAFVSNPLATQVSVEVKDVTVEGDTATLDMVFTVPGGLDPLPIPGESVKVDGEWMVGRSTICALGQLINVPCPA